VNIDKAEDVLFHQKVLAEAKDPDRRPAFAVRFLRVTIFSSCVMCRMELGFVHIQQAVKVCVKFWVL